MWTNANNVISVKIPDIEENQVKIYAKDWIFILC